ncbi:putative sulphate transporter; Sulfate transporter/antisigma-factor antagonist STAS domain [Cupriavidus taiwanensis]|uniref:Sulphate transporter Sulfate transporter/antisigma-factor antagonist STAS domain n=1 Tax=Cupriavidus taiwanensis TaxID=164546 RepID=A0A375ECK6_9BURK|nr:sulfate permease [Cupriavidus taiwanensis]SOZ66423.1 putative sulphate transporter; Sulfate transporter/antisigma-factor antagonist STAS domain [Cupriavidus taiwanensis]SOZ67224.1 putative sulphate transporter; Sulfate transporter/antisigma-factor antagonist STAS domain [Cupriavidus taiwanensis]SOZ70744.1 putative sulphate transporter; Sulfate transporter/antisigma-factor antagonist STAS domain [Cupriavidus taiwanensis]SPA02185.1 putative sulphate transporter; Sulfate transporter/antisigma-f
MQTEPLTPHGERSARREPGWWRWLPGLTMLRTYQAAWLPRDLAAGLVLTTMLVPVGIAYAEASGVPGVYGLYATVVPLLVYAVFGPSRVLVLGPDSALAAPILAVVIQVSAGDPARAIAAASMMAVVSGVVCIVMGLLRLGFITELLSKPIRYGYMNGIALTVLVSQLPKLFAISIDEGGPLREILALGRAILDGQANWYSFAVGAGSLVLILLLKRFERVPGILIAVVLATIAVSVFGLDRAGVKVLGPIPQGLPQLALPWLSGADLVKIVLGGCAVALIAFADTSVLSRTYAARYQSRVDPNQEMVGLGAANLAAGFFQGFPISSSASRTPVAEAAGAKTQLTGVVGALAVAVLLLVAPNLLQYLPSSALAAVVIAAALGLFEFADLRRIYRIQQWEFWLSMVCFAAVAVFGAIPGICLAVVIAVIEFLWDGWRPHFAVLGRVEGLRGYHDVQRYPHAKRIDGLLLFRWDAPLFFANAELFQERLMEAVEDSPTPVRRVVVAAEPVTSVDVTSADMLRELIRTLHARGIAMHLAEMKDPVRDKLKRFELLELIGENNFHATVGGAVDDYVGKGRAPAPGTG